MSKTYALLAALVVALALVGIVFKTKEKEKSPSTDGNNTTMTEENTHNGKALTLTSPTFGSGDMIPVKYTCDGEDVSPPFEITGVSGEAKSLVIVMEDPDVPASVRENGMWDHWVRFNIPADTTIVKEGEEPEGISGKGTNGSLNYHGPCPPDREHRYFFKLFSLDEVLEVPEGSSKEEVEEAMTGHILQKTELMGLYERERAS